MRRSNLGDFVWSADQDPESWNGFFRVEEGVSREISEVSPEEIRNVMINLLLGTINADENELMQETARIFGLKQLGSKIKSRPSSVLSWAVSQGDLSVQGGVYRLTKNEGSNNFKK